MRTWMTLSAALAVGVGAVAVAQVAQTTVRSADEPEVTVVAQSQADRYRNKSDAEIEKLEAQRAEIDAKLRELRRQSTRSRVRTYVTPRIITPEGVAPNIVIPPIPQLAPGTLNNLSPDQRREVERALEEANRAVQEAMRTLRENRVAIPDLKGLNDKNFRLFTSPDGQNKAFQFYWSPEDRAKFEKDMQKMREDLRDQMRTFKSVPPVPATPAQPFLYRSAPVAPGTDAGLRAEIEELRREVQSLRDELRRNRSRERNGDDRPAKPTIDPFNLF